MANQSPQKWAESFVADLVLDGERVPFDRVVKRHRQAVEEQRAKGLTWKNLANLLRRAGATRENGKAYSADHLRVAFGRTVGEAPSRLVNLGVDSDQTNSDTANSFPSSAKPPISHTSRPQVHSAQRSKDISDDELGLAMDRINKLKT